MKTRTTRPVAEDLKDLYEIAAREHGPQARSTRAIKRSLDTMTGQSSTAPSQREEVSRSAPSTRTGRHSIN